MKPETLEWIKKAEGDYQVAKKEFRSDKPVFDAVCFHAQQCIEKYLKAWFSENHRQFPRTHDLIVLFELGRDKLTELVIHRSSLAFLTTFAIAFRYPGDEALIEDAQEALEKMESIRLLLRWRLGVEKRDSGEKL